ncbi:MAG: HAD family hydrolase [Gemmatimonadota bacterium]|jgi:2-haloalkanoic acid dehalogenase type II
MSHAVAVEAITFDFFNTLVSHRDGMGGRGKQVMEYLQSHGIESEPWEHQVLYDVFEPHAREYSPAFSAEEKDRYHVRVAERLFRRLKVGMAAQRAAHHATEMWQLIGPRSLEVFPDVRPTLERLREEGYRLAVVSNWQCGLGHFCVELGLGGLFRAVIVSAEVGAEKPDRRMFEEACRHLKTEPRQVLHVGDSPDEDVEGAQAAGLNALLICRDHDAAPAGSTCIRTLEELPGRVKPANRPAGRTHSAT